MRAVVLLVPLLLLAGCASAPERNTAAQDNDPAPGSLTYRLAGAFTGKVTQADMAEAQALARAEGRDMLVMESFPPQFAVNGLDSEGCGGLRAALAAKSYVASVGACQEERQGGAPNEPTSSVSPPGNGSENASGEGPALAVLTDFREPPGPRSFRGTFTREYTSADARAVCMAGTGNETCALMKSDPPQYGFSFASHEACDAARTQVLAVPHVADVSICRGPPDQRLLGIYHEGMSMATHAESHRIGEAVGGALTGVHRGFLLDGVDARACAIARATLLARPYVAAVGECQHAPKERPYEAPFPDGAPEDAERPHAFHGSFHPDRYVAGDEAKVCEAAQGNTSCLILTSLPPQYGFENASLAECEATRARVVQAVAHVKDLSRCTGPTEFRVLGALSSNATSWERDLVHVFAAAERGNANVLGERVHADGFDAVGCERFRREMRSQAFVVQVGSCERLPRELPASSPIPADVGANATWAFDGTFRSTHNEPIRALFCETVGRPAGCVSLEAFPPVFHLAFATRTECETVRAKVLETTWDVTGVGSCAPGP